MSFLLWNRLPNIGMGSKGLRSGFFFLILKLKQSHCLHMETLQTVLSIILMRNPMCGGHLKPRQLMCVIRNCVSHSSGEWGWTPASGAHAWGSLTLWCHPQAGQLGVTSTVLSWWAVISWRTLGRQRQALQNDHLTELSISIMTLKTATVPYCVKARELPISPFGGLIPALHPEQAGSTNRISLLCYEPLLVNKPKISVASHLSPLATFCACICVCCCLWRIRCCCPRCICLCSSCCAWSGQTKHMPEQLRFARLQDG